MGPHLSPAVKEALYAGWYERAELKVIRKNLTRDEWGGFKWKMNLQGLFKNYDNINVAINLEEPVRVNTNLVEVEKGFG